MDRIDIFTFITSLSYDQISEKVKINESSNSIKCRVDKARKLQSDRYNNKGIYCNSQMNQKLIRNYCKLDESGNKLLEKIHEKFKLSNRAYSRILKLSRTIADLEGREDISVNDLVEAIQYRRFLNEDII